MLNNPILFHLNMLVVDVNKRIEWPDLFDHPIVHLKDR